MNSRAPPPPSPGTVTAAVAHYSAAPAASSASAPGTGFGLPGVQQLSIDGSSTDATAVHVHAPVISYTIASFS